MKKQTKTKTINLPPTYAGMVDWMLTVLQTEEPGSQIHTTAINWFKNMATIADTAVENAGLMAAVETQKTLTQLREY